MKRLVELIIISLFTFVWLWGIVLAKGWVLKMTAIFFFPYSFYLVVEKIVTALGLN